MSTFDRTTHRGRSLLALGIGLGAAIAISACGAPAATPAATTAGPTTPAAGSPAAGATAAPKAEALADSITISTTALNANWDPLWTLSNTGMQAQRMVHDALVILDDKGGVNPMLAVSWSQLNPTTMQFKLRTDVKFHNGDSFTAADVVANVERMVKATNAQQISTRAQRFPTITGAVAVDPATVNITTQAPDPILLNRVANLFITSPKQFSQEVILGTPIGTGSFKATTFTTAQIMAGEAFEGSWKQQKPQFKTIRYVQVPEQATAVAGLRAGDIDIAYDIPPDSISELRAGGFQSLAKIIADVNVIDLAPSFPGLADKRVRQALNHAVNKDEVLKSVYANTGRAMDGQLAYAELPSYNPNLKAYTYDVALARQLLQQAGAANLKLSAGGAAGVGKQILEPVQAYFQAVGVQMDLNIYPFARYASLQNNVEPGKDPVWHTRTNYFNYQDLEQALANYVTTAPSKRYANPDFDAKVTQIRSEMNPQVRSRLMQEASAIMREDPPTIIMHQHGFVFGMSPKIQNLTPLYDTSFNLEVLRKLR